MDPPKFQPTPVGWRPSQPKFNRLRTVLASITLSSLLLLSLYSTAIGFVQYPAANAPSYTTQSRLIAQCHNLNAPAGPSPDFHQRSQSDRFQEGTRPVLIKNAKIWTGATNATEVVEGDILLHNGLIKRVGHLGAGAHTSLLEVHGTALVVVDAGGAWVTPGIVDVHSHAGVGASPALSGADDGNSFRGIIQPWLRSLDGLNTHDDSYALSIAGGVTTSLILPGSANAIGGQAFVIKLRKTAEKSASSMLLEPPHTINASFPDPNSFPRWRHIKHACGENPSDVYDGTRMDTFWEFRKAYDTAKQIKERQDKYCARALANDWEGLGEFPEELKWEVLVDILRGRVKVNTHCYEAVDMDDFVRLSNEFQFPIAAFHHASEAYLIPDRLKQAYGKPPAIALFAVLGRYKRESYRASEFAPRILAENGITVLMKSDHPSAVNSRYLLHEAQIAHYYGLPENLALASVITNAAETLGMGHRVGYIREGYDADLVIWDSHPLALGATPRQVFIDGIAQLESPVTIAKPDAFYKSPKVPNFDKEAEEAVAHDGLPPLTPKKVSIDTTVVFKNVKSIHLIRNGSVKGVHFIQDEETDLSTVVTQNGSIVCYGRDEACLDAVDEQDSAVLVIDLEGGSILPGLVSFGCPLGMVHILLDDTANDGAVSDPLDKSPPSILGKSPIIRAVDGLQYGSRDALLAYRAGITTGVVAPMSEGFLSGLSASFSLSASHKLEKGAVVKDVTAVHVNLRMRSTHSLSTQIAALRRLLSGSSEGEIGSWFEKVRAGRIPLVVEAHNADIIATLIVLKKEVEAETGTQIRLTITGAAEASLLAKELSEAKVGVILSPARPFPHEWEDRRILPGPPISNNSAVMELINNDVLVGLGCENMWISSARNLPSDLAWAAIESGGRISKSQAIAMGSTNMLQLLGVDVQDVAGDLVATRGGGLLDLESKVAAILSPRQEIVHIF